MYRTPSPEEKISGAIGRGVAGNRSGECRGRRCVYMSVFLTNSCLRKFFTESKLIRQRGHVNRQTGLHGPCLFTLP